MTLGTSDFRYRNILAFAVPWALLFLTYYFGFRKYGIYEDDIFFIGLGSEIKSWEDAWLIAISHFTTWPFGRPLAFTLDQWIPYLGETLGGNLSTQYLIGFCILGICGWLLASVSRLLLKNEISVFICVATYYLWPSDTNKVLIHHVAATYMAAAFFLSAFLLYLKGHRWGSLPFLFLSLITYESFYPMGLAFPLFDQFREPKKQVERSKHLKYLLSFFVIFIAYMIFRKSLGETRMSGINQSPLDLLNRITVSMLEGFQTGILSLKLYLPLQFKNFDLSMIFFTMACFGSLWILCRTDLPAIRQKSSNSFLRIAGLSALLCCFGYAGFALSADRYPPVATYGRMNSVHSAGLIGLSLMFASFIGFAIKKIPWKDVRIFAIVVSIVGTFIFTSLGLIGKKINNDFVRAWELTQKRISLVASQMKPFHSGQRVFVVIKNEEETKSIRANSWTDSILLLRSLNFPTEWNYPRIKFVSPFWKDEFSVQVTDLGITWNKPADVDPPSRQFIEAVNLELLEINDLELPERPIPLDLNRLGKNLPDAKLTRFGHHLFGVSRTP